MTALWIVGPTRSGKTVQLIEQLTRFATKKSAADRPWLIFAANGDNRIALADRLADTVQDRIPHTTTTPAD